MKTCVPFRRIRKAISCMVKGFSGTTGAQDSHVRVFIDPAVKDVHDNQTVIVLIYPK